MHEHNSLQTSVNPTSVSKMQLILQCHRGHCDGGKSSMLTSHILLAH